MTELRTRVGELALAQLIRDSGGEEEVAEAAAAQSGESMLAFAMRSYTFKECSDCKAPFFTGAADCGAGLAQEAEGAEGAEPEVAICSGCAARKGSIEKCEIHGTTDMMWKCRYCCRIASFECFTYAHFCPDCHESPLIQSE
jgi:hypothetical protein